LSPNSIFLLVVDHIKTKYILFYYSVYYYITWPTNWFTCTIYRTPISQATISSTINRSKNELEQEALNLPNQEVLVPNLLLTSLTYDTVHRSVSKW